MLYFSYSSLVLLNEPCHTFCYTYLLKFYVFVCLYSYQFKIVLQQHHTRFHIPCRKTSVQYIVLSEAVWLFYYQSSWFESFSNFHFFPICPNAN
jgi:hypothetical protein